MAEANEQEVGQSFLAALAALNKTVEETSGMLSNITESLENSNVEVNDATEINNLHRQA